MEIGDRIIVQLDSGVNFECIVGFIAKNGAIGVRFAKREQSWQRLIFYEPEKIFIIMEPNDILKEML